MSICVIKDFGLLSKALTDRLGQVLDIEVASTMPAHCENLIYIKESSSSPSFDDLGFGSDSPEFDFLNDLNLRKCAIVYLSLNGPGDSLFQNYSMIDDSELGKMELQIYNAASRDRGSMSSILDQLANKLSNFFTSRENPKKAFPRIPKIPNCPSIVTDDSTMPPLLNEQGLTDYPNKGDNKPILFKNSKFKLFPFKLALDIMEEMPETWCKGGNQFGNLAFAYWIKAMRAMHNNKPIPKDSQRWMKKREGYIARHRADKRPAGVIAMIKWAGFVDGDGARANGAVDGSSLQMMLDVIGYKK